MGNCACHASRHGGVPGTAGDDADTEPAWAERGEACSEERRKSVKVTVRISKSRLHELMASGVRGAEGMTTLGNVLAEIVSAGEVVDGRHRRRGWEPALESIPEAMEP